jgi:hypothetical protein
MVNGNRKGMYCNSKVMLGGKCHRHMGSQTYGSIKLRLKPNEIQKHLQNKYFGCKRKTYNLCVDNDKNYTLTEKELLSNFVYELHGTDTEYIENEVLKDKKYLFETPKQIRHKAVSDYITARDNALKQYERDKNYEIIKYLRTLYNKL